MNSIFNYYSDIVYDIYDYYNNSIPDDLEYWNDNAICKQLEQCYEEYELQKEVDALIEERSWEESFRCMAIQRIAREAQEKKVSYTLIFKFLNEYEIQPNERVWFWMEYYNY